MDHYSALALDSQLCFALYRTSRAVIRAYQPLLQELGLTYPQYLAMVVLWESDGPCPMGELAQRLDLDSGTLTPLMRRLEQAGYVTRNRDPQDERRLLLALTPAGQALQDEATRIPADLEQIYRDSEVDLRGLKGDLDTLSAALVQD